MSRRKWTAERLVSALPFAVLTSFVSLTTHRSRPASGHPVSLKPYRSVQSLCGTCSTMPLPRSMT